MNAFLKRALGKSYDAVVVGGGPAGSTAARILAAGGVATLLVERKNSVGQPVRCGEGVPRQKFEALVGDVDRRWISADVNGGVGHSPSDVTVRRDYAGVGYILNRELFDRDLFARAAAAGATTILGAEVCGVTFADGRAEVSLRDGDGGGGTVSCGAVIGADGVESVVGRAAGLATTLSPGDVDVCAEYLLAGAPIAYPDYIHFFLGRCYAPGGYAWVFPKDNAAVALVGVGITPSHAGGRGPFFYLDEFVAGHFPGAKVLEVRSGAVPAAKPLPRITAACAALVGDAARQPDPFSGEGICQALTAGGAAASAVARGLGNGNLARELLGYEEEWENLYGKRYRQHYKVRQVILAMNDREIDDTVTILRDKLDLSMIKSSEIFATFLSALWKNPKLILKMRHLLS